VDGGASGYLPREADGQGLSGGLPMKHAWIIEPTDVEKVKAFLDL
jgi:hypothetical protein